MIEQKTEEQKKKTPAVINGVMQFTSPTAIQRHMDCERKWYWRYVVRIPDKKKGKGAIRGDEGHQRLTHFYRTGQNILDPLEHLALELGILPEPGEGILPAYQLGEGLLAAGIPVKGEIDLVDIRSLPSSGVMHFFDWKFKAKKTIQKFPVSREDLIDPTKEAGIQMLSYAKKLLIDFPQTAALMPEHTTFQTNGRREVFPTPVSIDPAGVSERWNRVVTNVEGMKLTARVTNPFDVPMNELACEKYGGCAYRDKCFDPVQRVLRGMRHRAREEGNMGLFGGVVKNGATAPATPAAVPAPPVQVAPPPVAEKRIIVERHDLAPVPPQPPGRAAAHTAMAAAAPTIAGRLPMVLPPDAPPSNPALASEPEEPATGVPAATARGRGRPRKDAVPVSRTDAPGAPAPANVISALQKAAAQVQVAPAPAAAPVAASPSGVKLYFNCAPRSASRSLHDYTERLEKMLLESVQMQHVYSDLRCATDNVLGFDHWKGHLAILVKEDDLPEPGHYVVQTGADSRVDVVADALSRKIPPENVTASFR